MHATIFIWFKNLQFVQIQPQQLKLGETGNLNFVAFFCFSPHCKLLGSFHLGSNHQNNREVLSLPSSSGVGAKTLFTVSHLFSELTKLLCDTFEPDLCKMSLEGYLDSMFIACSLQSLADCIVEFVGFQTYHLLPFQPRRYNQNFQPFLNFLCSHLLGMLALSLLA